MNSSAPTTRPADKPPRRRMDREARKRQLLDCAITAFAERGTARAGHADVARLAAVSVATVFEYFPTRERLLDAVLREIEQFLYALMAIGAGAAATDVRSRVLDIFHAFQACVDEQPQHMRVWLDWSTSVREGVWLHYVEVQERIIDMLEQMIEAGRTAGSICPAVIAGDAARILVGQAHMIVMMRFASVDQATVVRFIDHLIDSALPPVPTTVADA
ncbi:TetR/AcrR family transcriptional regulator [Panacagrimonas sp.]|uniref:TetR/AcrR family transcriptional regulator n=1 Tax=Panacagrimonas sp. TaxID=2480088 RepID=UPI003B527772